MVSFSVDLTYVYSDDEFDDFDNKATRWLCVMIYRICMHDNDYVTDFHLMVMLRSTTGPYGRLVIEVTYGEMILSLHRGCIGDDSSGRVVGVSA